MLTMKPSHVFISIGFVVLLLLCACGERAGSASVAVAQTKFPGQVTAGGGTSGEVLARNAQPKTDGSSTGGTPFHAGGAGGNTGGAATAGTVQEPGHGPASGAPTGAGAPAAASASAAAK